MNIKRISRLSLLLLLLFFAGARSDIVQDRLNWGINDYYSDPWPSPASPDPGDWTWGKAGYALACLAMNADITTANIYIDDLCNLENPIPPTGTNDTIDIYFKLPMIVRMYLDPNMNSHLTADNKSNIERVLWQFSKPRSKVSDAEMSVWHIQDSENHDIIQKSMHLLGCQALKNAPAYGPNYVLDDGKTVEQHYEAWKKYFFEYFRQRAREGLNCEIASISYAGYTVGCCYNIWRLTDSLELSKLAKDWITLYWADHAADFLTVTGVRGASGTRWYKDSLINANDTSLSAILYAYDWHDNLPLGVHPFALLLFTSPYRNPAIVDKIGAAAERVPYLSSTRRFGKGGAWVNHVYHVTFDANHNSDIRRDTWRHRDYVIGSLSLRTDADVYTSLIDQNRAMGVMFGSNISDRLIFHGKGTIDNGRTGYLEISGVCGKNCLVAAWDKNANSNAGVRIFVSGGSLLSNKADDGGWIFTKTGLNGLTGYYVLDANTDRHNDLQLGDKGTFAHSPVLTSGGEGQSGEALRFVKSLSNVANSTAQWASDNSAKIDFYFKADRNDDFTDQVIITAKDTWQVFINGASVKFSIWERSLRTLTLNNIVNTGAWQHVQAWVNADGSAGLTVDGVTTTSNGGRLKVQAADIILGNKTGMSMYYGGLVDSVRITIPSQNNRSIAEWNMDSLYSRDVYAGIRIVNGAYTQSSVVSGGAMLDFSDKYSPVIFEIAPSADYASFTDFKNACKGRPFNYDTAAKCLTYTSTAGDTYEYWGNSGNLPKINGSTINLNPAKTYDSPYLQGWHGLDTVKISYPGMSDLMLDFCYHDSPVWDDYQTVALWHMDTLSSGKILDDDLENSTRNNDLTLYNGLTVTAGSGGKFEEALSFDGSDDYGNAINGWTACSSVKLDMWIYPTSGSGSQCITTAPNIWDIKIVDGKLQFSTWHPALTASPLIHPTGMTLNQWHRIIATCDPQGYRRLIIDGNFVSDAIGEGLISQNSDINVGYKAGSDFYAGKIDDLKISQYPVPVKPLKGDMNNDRTINFFDFAKFVEQWLNTCDGRGWCNNSDTDYNGRVDFDDIAVMTDTWLIDCVSTPGVTACFPD